MKLKSKTVSYIEHLYRMMLQQSAEKYRFLISSLVFWSKYAENVFSADSLLMQLKMTPSRCRGVNTHPQVLA